MNLKFLYSLIIFFQFNSYSMDSQDKNYFEDVPEELKELILMQTLEDSGQELNKNYHAIILTCKDWCMYLTENCRFHKYTRMKEMLSLPLLKKIRDRSPEFWRYEHEQRVRKKKAEFRPMYNFLSEIISSPKKLKNDREENEFSKFNSTQVFRPNRRNDRSADGLLHILSEAVRRGNIINNNACSHNPSESEWDWDSE